MNQCLVTLRKARQASNGEVAPDADRCTAGWRRCSGSMHLHRRRQDLEGVPVRLDLSRLLQVLKPVQRRILEMAYLEDVPDQEIAEMLGMTLSSVKSQIHHAKRRVRKIHKKR